MMRRATMMCCLLVLVGLGCGGSSRPSLVPASGTVKLDGEPLAGAQLAFIMTEGVEGFARPLSATTNASGEFQLSTYAIGDGAPIGKYKVTVIKKEPTKELPEDFNVEVADQYNISYRWVTPMKYSSPDESGLTAEITSDGLQPAVIDLSSEGATPYVEATGSANEP